MSDNILRIIPQHPEVVPPRHLLREASRLLSIYLKKDKDIRIIVTNETRFIDCGANFKEVRCPSSGRIIDAVWWREAMDQAYARRFQQLAVRTPCCDPPTSLNDLFMIGPPVLPKYL